ncbi:MAG TPA: NUDIX domain-containing protein [Geobacteraceae bacterium]|nr:NUDIX domain-containing protein [Geobacteraceae bacterium]
MVVAAICLRSTEQEIQVLLVKSFPGKSWIYPQGLNEADETPVGTALRELAEEAGWTGKVASGLVYRLHGFDEQIQGYALVSEAKQTGEPAPGRLPSWFNLSLAVLKLQENRPQQEAMGLILALRQAVKWYMAN